MLWSFEPVKCLRGAERFGATTRRSTWRPSAVRMVSLVGPRRTTVTPASWPNVSSTRSRFCRGDEDVEVADGLAPTSQAPGDLDPLGQGAARIPGDQPLGHQSGLPERTARVSAAGAPSASRILAIFFGPNPGETLELPRVDGRQEGGRTVDAEVGPNRRAVFGPIPRLRISSTMPGRDLGPQTLR